MIISVVIPTYNPDIKRLNLVLKALEKQTFTTGLWELIIIDNNSTNGFDGHLNLTNFSFASILKEPKQGLTYARLKGFEQALGEFIIMVDDDNILEKNYLSLVYDIFKNGQNLGAIGGKSLPLFELQPPLWLDEFKTNLALRDLGDNIITDIWQQKYPQSAPIGAGMGIRKTALESYIQKVKTSQTIISDRKGNNLSSGGDNDIVIEILKSGWSTGYFPDLQLQHVIPAERMQVAYIAKLINNTNKSWVQLLKKHNISPWKKIPQWSVRFRKIKAWITHRAWQNDAAYIRWRGACGLYDGLAN